MRKRGLETAASDFDESDAGMEKMESSGQDISQHGRDHEVKADTHFCKQTKPDTCRTPDVMPRNTRIAQVTHKNRTRDLLESQIDIPHDLYQLLIVWPILSMAMKKAIMELVNVGSHESKLQKNDIGYHCK